MLQVVLKKINFKLTINSVYGKTRENLRKRINVRLVNNETDFLKYTSRPTHITHKIFRKIYAAVHKIKPVLTLNKPVYVGFATLQLMHGSHCRFIQNNLKLNCYFLTQTVLLMK